MEPVIDEDEGKWDCEELDTFDSVSCGDRSRGRGRFDRWRSACEELKSADL